MTADTLTANGSATTLDAPGPNSVQPYGYNYVETGYVVIPGQDEVAMLYRGTAPNSPPDLVVTAYSLQGAALFEKSFSGTPQPAGSPYAYAGASSGVITVLDNGNLVVGDITYAYPNYPVEFSILSPSGAVVATGSDPAPGGYNVPFNLAVAVLPGQFELSSDAEKSGSAVMTRVSRLVSDSGAYSVVETNQTDTHLPATSFAEGADGVFAAVYDNFFRYGTAQGSVGAALPNEPAETVTSNAAAPLTSGLGVAAWVDSGAAHVAVFDPGYDAFRPAATVDWSGASDVHVVALPDAGYVVSWMKDGAYKGEVFGADGTAGGVISLAGDVAGIDSHGDLYTVNANASQYQVQTYTISGSGSGSGGSTSGSGGGGSQNGGETFVAATTATLGGSPHWTAAAMLSSHTLTVVGVADGAYGSHFGVEQSYDSSGTQTGSHALMGYAGAGQTLVPQITALSSGFYEVTYAGSSDYEIYNANDQRVFFHNQYTSPTATLSPLLNGGYVTTDSSSSVFGLFDANNANVGWISMPSDAPSLTPVVNALNGGGFVFTYAGTNHFDLYDASGDLLEGGNFSASGSQFAQDFAPLAGNGNGFHEAWMSPDGSTYNGVATSLDIQVMGPKGAISPAITVTQDLDPGIPSSTFRPTPTARWRSCGARAARRSAPSTPMVRSVRPTAPGCWGGTWPIP